MAASQALLARVLVADEPAEDATGERILDATLEQVQLFGLRRTSVEDTARRAGVGRMTVYRRFGSKDGLVEALLLRESRRFFAGLDRAIGPLATAEERVVEGFAAGLRGARGHPLLSGLLATEPEVLLPYLTVDGGPVLGLVREYLAGHLRAAREQGELGPIDPEAVAEVLARLGLSFLITPDGSLPLDGDREAREFARRYLVPMLAAG
jgi:AcrR family transcriptional regulator